MSRSNRPRRNSTQIKPEPLSEISERPKCQKKSDAGFHNQSNMETDSPTCASSLQPGGTIEIVQGTNVQLLSLSSDVQLESEQDTNPQSNDTSNFDSNTNWVQRADMQNLSMDQISQSKSLEPPTLGLSNENKNQGKLIFNDVSEEHNNNSLDDSSDSGKKIPESGIKILKIEEIQESFTLDEDVGKLEVCDATASFFGFIDYVGDKDKTLKNGSVSNIVLNNNSETRIQISAWNELMPKLQNIAKIGYIIEAENLLVKSDDKSFNRGSIPKYFEVQDISNFTIIGRLQEIPKDCTIMNVTFDRINKARGNIRIRGVIKTPPRLSVSKQFGNKIIGGITNGNDVIEIQLPQELKVDYIEKGDHVEIIGLLQKKSIGVHVIKIEDIQGIVKLENARIENLEYFLQANNHI
ncbi:hypothetical protein QAD02_020551 [Eretmocerus hayati]|uniref:Uncharacterized protein n=1 Tax=Eretmocerus hayati TaxID=131215 RepID=A0ACC2PMS8_9HYME|nr:hypothetical protein QAD02_020551 [Eretmocerus hayati]